jgi:hypothetical protein
MICGKSKAIPVVLLAVFLAPPADASSACPLTLLSGTVEPNGISVTFRNTGKLPIRWLEFTCKPVDAQGDKAHRAHCFETNASFMPETVYTTSYAFSGVPGPVLVSVKRVTFSDGRNWEPSQRVPCRVLKLVPPRGK